jgi:SAM-dependent methyltransferase
VDNPAPVGLRPQDLAGMAPDQRELTVVGEYLAQLAAEAGKIASECLFKAQWGFRQPDWFDHRHHVLDPVVRFTDHWTMSADNVIDVLPLGATLLNLCSGDGFYDYYFYRPRAGEIVCVDVNPVGHAQAVRLHSAPNIRHVLHDVLTYEPAPGHFDVVCIRGAIEHFSEDNQRRIFDIAKKAMKPGGWFCGDTPANPNPQALHAAHEKEWADEAEMRAALSVAFRHIESKTIVSETRTSLFWRCQA